MKNRQKGAAENHLPHYESPLAPVGNRHYLTNSLTPRAKRIGGAGEGKVFWSRMKAKEIAGREREGSVTL
jgi:hypothetical protein